MTNTQIANLALAKIAQPALVSLDEQTVVAEQVRTHFDLVRREVLASVHWPFATRRVLVPRLSAAPAFGFAYAFQLPTDYLSVIDANAEDDSRLPPEAYMVEGNALLSDSATCKLRYVADVTDPNQFTPQFAAAFAHLLAARIAPAVTGDPQLGMLLEQQAVGLSETAAAANQNESYERIPDYRLQSESINARFQ